MSATTYRTSIISHHDGLIPLLGERDDVRGGVGGTRVVDLGCEDGCGGRRWVSGELLAGIGGEERGDRRGERGTDLRRLRV